MGATIKGFEESLKNKTEIQAYTMDKMSNAVVRVLDKLAQDEEIFKLLYYRDDISLRYDLQNDPVALEAFNNRSIIKNKNDMQYIKAYPFSSEPTTTEDVSIRVYFSNGAMSEANVYSKATVTIDVICSHNLWLTSGKDIKLVRPYALVSRINKLLEDEKVNKLPTPTGFSHLTVNSVFECIRIYAETVDIEDGGSDGDN